MSQSIDINPIHVGVYLLAAVFFYQANCTSTISVPKVKKTQEGFVPLSKLELDCTDFDGNTEWETVIKIDGKPHFLRYDANNKPVLQPYEVKPAELLGK